MPQIGIPGIIVCSRKNSSRVFNKPFQKVANKALINHLFDRLAETGIGLCLAIPREELEDYQSVIGDHMEKKINYYFGYPNDPLARMHNASQMFMLDPIIRVNHDKIFVEPDLIKRALALFQEKNLDYLYSSHLVDGSGFEIISRSKLKEAFTKFADHDVEHISYAIKALNPKSHDFKEFHPIYRGSGDMRFLIDYQADLDFIRIVHQNAGHTLKGAIKYVGANMHLTKINKLPKVTIYTCAYNAEKFITQSILSAMSQTIFNECEYIIIDDCSTDQTLERILNFSECKNIIIKRNDSNLGLASSSNIALDLARGKHIIRLDADDTFIFPNSIEMLLDYAKEKGSVDAVYPTYIDEKSRQFVHGRSCHHVGGSLFSTSAVSHVKFTEKLRGYEGLDFFNRAKRQIKICYYNRCPTFYYRHNPNSMSCTNLEDRKIIADKISLGLTGDDLL